MSREIDTSDIIVDIADIRANLLFRKSEFCLLTLDEKLNADLSAYIGPAEIRQS